VEELDGDHDWMAAGPTESTVVENGNEIQHSNIVSSAASLSDNADLGKRLIWDDANDSDSTSQQPQQQQQYYPEWGNEQTLSQHNQQHHQQQHHQQQNHQQQNNYYQHQYQQQQHQPYSQNMNNQWQQRSQQHPEGQLVLHHHRRNNKYYSPTPSSSNNFLLSPTTRAKIHAASNLLSRTVKKLQTGIVSETIDATKKVSSTVSTLTSRFGTTTMMSGSRGSANNNNNAANGGGGGVRIGHPPQQQQRQQQQQPSHPVINNMYAPPMSELFSFDKEEELENNNNDDDNDDDDGYSIDNNDYYNDKTTTTTNPRYMDNESDDEDEEYNEITTMQQQQWKESIPKQTASSSGDYLINTAHSSSRPSDVPTTERQRVYQYNNNNDKDDDDDDYTTTSSSRQKLMSILSKCIPRLSTNIFRRHSSLYYDDGSWSDDEAKESSTTLSRIGSSRRTIVQSSSSSSVVVPRQVQSLFDKRNTLLSSSGTKSCISIGRTQAVLDACQLALVVYIFHEAIPLYVHVQTLTSSTDIRTAVITTLTSSTLLHGWAPYALIVILLLSISNSVWVQPSLKATYTVAALENISNVTYTQLYLRLLTSQPISKSIIVSNLIKGATYAQALQVASTARLWSFITIVSLYMLLSTVAVLRQAMELVISAIRDIVHLDIWKILPIDWKNILVAIESIGKSLTHSLRVLIDMEVNSLRQQPLRIVMVVSLIVSFIGVSYLPFLEIRRKSSGKLPTKRTIISNDLYEEENDDEESTIPTLWSNIGSSSASRLHLLTSNPRGVQGALEQYATLRPDRAIAAGIRPVTRQLMRKSRRNNNISNRMDNYHLLTRVVAYSFFSLIILSVPLVTYLYFFMSINTVDKINWVSLLDLTALLVFTYIRTTTATNDAIQSNIIRLGRNSLNEFFHTLAETVMELTTLATVSSSKVDYQAMMTASPTEGITVKDLWASHSSRRAWAIKGANISCRNGEVCLILGVDGAGKTCLLTAIAEQLFTPPKTARATTYVRGSINISGVDITKWGRRQLQKRIGVHLNDVRIVSDYASLLSGCSLEEILEPIHEGGRASPKNPNSLSVAMQVSPYRFATI
jgi:ABC-type multidrug transport system fused ATPase/permease subunit